jgi:hypothetical protein
MVPLSCPLFRTEVPSRSFRTSLAKRRYGFADLLLLFKFGREHGLFHSVSCASTSAFALQSLTMTAYAERL